MSDLINRQAAIDAVLDLSEKVADEMLFIDAIVDEIENLPSAEPERTAKVKVAYRDESIVFGYCACGQAVNSYSNYCPTCGCRLEWE